LCSSPGAGPKAHTATRSRDHYSMAIQTPSVQKRIRNVMGVGTGFIYCRWHLTYLFSVSYNRNAQPFDGVRPKTVCLGERGGATATHLEERDSPESEVLCLQIAEVPLPASCSVVSAKVASFLRNVLRDKGLPTKCMRLAETCTSWTEPEPPRPATY